MKKELDIRVDPEMAATAEGLLKACARHSGIPEKDIRHVEVVRRSWDARKGKVRLHLKVRVYVQEDFEKIAPSLPDYPDVSRKEEVLIIGAGPAGLFAALQCIKNGRKPVILERGKDVRARRRDLKALNLKHLVHEDSNYCFGEGGAGTYSDGKLYTRSTKRGDVYSLLRMLVAFGAPESILVDAHPHIGTNKLPAIIENIRNFIIGHGGEIHFNRRVHAFILNGASIHGVRTLQGDTFRASRIILATGHSARDIFRLLHQNRIAIEPKPFALGVRVEHPQTLIDRIQYKCQRNSDLPPASYRIVKQIKGRGVYSFCMCPGGVIAPCATAPEEVVTNGWSPSRRNQPYANSGVVVELRLSDFRQFQSYGPLAAMEFQKAVEHKCWQAAGKTQRVPAQRLSDFVAGRLSSDLPCTSYKPGITSVELSQVLPDFIYHRLVGGFIAFGRAMPGYLSQEAVVHAPESRTSSPVRIPRHPQTLEHIHIHGLFPCGEGSGYAGGIISAALDGQRCAEAACHI
ncbi:MAG: FAD-dependent dehydrogenase [Chitinophagales bacterium]|nr:MAG: FAD-dependent dehydrogenase [Chitinophagales bacterium]